MKQMTCREFDEVVHGLVRLELLDVGLREEALAHAARCGNCAEQMVAARALADTAETLADSFRSQQASSSVKDALLLEFRSHRRRKVWWQTFEWATAGAAVAMVVALMWNSYARPRTPAAPLPKKDVESQSRRPLEATGPETALPDNFSLAADTDIPSETITTGTLEESNFVPVPYARSIEPQESGMIVRVQLTRGSLAELGYPIAEVPGEDSIRADVLVDEEGWPRAVRVLQ